MLGGIALRIALRARGLGCTAAELGALSDDDWHVLLELANAASASPAECAAAVDLVQTWEARPA